MDVSLGVIIALASVPLTLGLQPNISYAGCFHVPVTSLQDAYLTTGNNLASLCVNKCYNEGYQYAAIKRMDMQKCGCGRDIPYVSEKYEDSMCFVECPGNRSLTCGSYVYYSVYEILTFKTTISVDKLEGFIFAYMKGVDYFNVSHPNDPQSILRTPYRVKYVDYHWKKQMLFAFTLYTIFSSNMGNDSTAKELTSVPSTVCEAFAVDWVHDRLIWADCKENVQIKSTDLDGSNSVTILNRKIDPYIRFLQVDPNARKIFWTIGKAIETCDLNGRNLQTNLTRTSFPLRGLALDQPTKRVFFVGLGMKNATGTMYSIKYSGEDLTAHFNCKQLISIYGLDIYLGIVYWTNYENKDVVYCAPLEDITLMRKITVVVKSVWHIRLVHPDLQPYSSVDPCLSLNCSYRCVDGHCVCPEHQHLAPDLKACRGNEESLVNVTHVGCFSIISDSAVGESTFYFENITLGICADQCRVHETRYIAVDVSSGVCHCGPDIPYESNKFDDAMCDLQCPDRASSWCGGDGVYSVYDIVGDTINEYNFGVGILVGTSDGVLMLNTSRKFDHSKLRDTRHHIDTVDYHWEKQLAFSLDTGGNLFRSPLRHTTAENNVSVKIYTMTTCDGFAVDWVHDKIFWAHCAGDLYDYYEESDPVVTIKNIDLEGKDENILVTRHTDKLIRRMVVDPYAGKLFWVASGHIIESCDLDGDNLNIIYNKTGENGRSNLLEIFLDLNSRRIFFISDLALHTMDYSGDDRKICWRNVDELRYVYGLGLMNSAVYWVNWAVQKSTDVLYQAPLSDSNGLQVVRDIQGVWHMRVVHPSLQSDPCTFPNCLTKCDTNSTDCRVCPDFCKTEIQSASVGVVQDSVFLGLFILVAMFSLVSVLLYYSDKYWTTITSRISPMSVPQYRQDRNIPSARVSEDSENLIDD